MTSLLKGQAVNVRLCSTSVTVRRGSSFFNARAQLAPAKPPPTTTTRPAAPCATAGIGSNATDALAAAALRNVRRLLVPLDPLVPAKAGTQGPKPQACETWPWVPAFAGM